MFLRQREERKTASRLPFGLPSAAARFFFLFLAARFLRSVFGCILRNVTERYRLSANPAVQTAAELYRKQSFGRTSGYRCPAGGGGFGKSIRVYIHAHTYVHNIRIYVCAARDERVGGLR